MGTYLRGSKIKLIQTSTVWALSGWYLGNVVGCPDPTEAQIWGHCAALNSVTIVLINVSVHTVFFGEEIHQTICRPTANQKESLNQKQTCWFPCMVQLVQQVLADSSGFSGHGS